LDLHCKFDIILHQRLGIIMVLLLSIWPSLAEQSLDTALCWGIAPLDLFIHPSPLSGA